MLGHSNTNLNVIFRIRFKGKKLEYELENSNSNSSYRNPFLEMYRKFCLLFVILWDADLKIEKICSCNSSIIG